MGNTQANERAEWLIENLSGYANFARVPMPLTQALSGAGLTPQRAYDLCAAYAARTEPHNAAGLIRRNVLNGFAKAVLLNDESELASFLTYGFAELDFNVKPGRQDLVLQLFKVLTDVFRGLKIPVVVAFDQLEDLLLARRNDDVHRTAERLSSARTKTGGQRALDILHVATALHLGAQELLTFDDRRRKLATAEGLNVHP